MTKETKLLDPIFPGEILVEEFMRPLDISIVHLSKELAVSEPTLSDITQGKGAMTAEIAMKLGDYFGTSPDLWLGLQMDYESRLAKREVSRLAKRELIPCADVKNQTEQHASIVFA